MAEFGTDVLHQILVRLDVEDLVRYKSVCKLWLSLISDQCFIKTHLNYSYNKSSIMGQTRIVLSEIQCECNHRDTCFVSWNFRLLGSAHGLICIYHVNVEVLVINLLTGEVRKVPKPLMIDIGSPFCWGFGYDCSTDDYKVVLGLRASEDVKCYQVLSLKSNVWRLIGKLKYTVVKTIGTFCNGALHWFMNDENEKDIVSFDLAREKFKEIPQPDEASYSHSFNSGLGVIQDKLCISCCPSLRCRKWVMKNYNVKQSWELMPFIRKSYNSAACYLKYRLRHKSSCGDVRIWFSLRLDDFCDPIFVPSLVSPHVRGKLDRKRNREARNNESTT